MGRHPRLACSLVLALLATSVTSGCLRDEIFPEPYAWTAGDRFEGRGDAARDVPVPADAQRLRFSMGLQIGQAGSLLGGPAGVQLRLRDPEGRIYGYNLTRSGTTLDTFGGDVGGTWRASISDPGGSANHDLAFFWYVPKYDDWAWWKVWKH